MQNSNASIELGNESIKSRTQLSRLVWRKKEISLEKNLPFDLSVEDLPPIPPFCPALGIPLVVADAGKADDFSPSLDRIVPSRGYTKDNVIWVSNLCNRIKGSNHWEDLLAVAEFYRKNFPEMPKNTKPRTVQEVNNIRNAAPSDPVYKNWGNKLQKETARYRKEQLKQSCKRELVRFIESNIPLLSRAPFKYSDIEPHLKQTGLWKLLSRLLPTEGAKLFAESLRDVIGEKNILKNRRSQYYIVGSL